MNINSEDKFKTFLQFFFQNDSLNPSPLAEIVLNHTTAQYVNTFGDVCLDKVWNILQEKNAEGYIFHIGFNPRKEFRGVARSSASNVVPVNFALDLDIHLFNLSRSERDVKIEKAKKKVLNKLQEAGLHPNALVKSGNGYQFWFKYGFPQEEHKFHARNYRILQEALLEIAGIEDKCTLKMGQLLRLPYSFNRKGDTGKDRIGMCSDDDVLVMIEELCQEENDWESLLKSDVAQKILKRMYQKQARITKRSCAPALHTNTAPCIQYLLDTESEVPEGYRWATLKTLSIYLFHNGVSAEEAIVKCSHIHSDQREVQKAVQGIYAKLAMDPEEYRFGCREGSNIQELIEAGITVCEKNLCYSSGKLLLAKDAQPTEEDLKKKDLDITTAFAYFNYKHAIVNISGKYAILDKYPAVVGGMWICSSFQNFQEAHSWIKVRTSTGESLKVVDLWLNSPRAVRYQGVDFLPMANMKDFPAPATIYNTWKGFKQAPVQGDCSLFRNHIEKHLCHFDSKLYNYVYSWMKHVILHPDVPTGVSFVVRGPEGSGKGIIFSYIANMFYRQNILEVADKKPFEGNFNNELSQKILVLLDEAINRQYDKKIDGTVKNAITSKYRLVYKKYIDPFEERNYCNFMFFSNNDHLVAASEIARRYFCLDMTNELCKDDQSFTAEKRKELRDYWRALWAEAEGDGPSAFMYWLLNEFEGKVDILNVPQTEELQRQRDLTSGAIDLRKFLESCCRNGILVDRGYEGVYWPEQPIVKELFNYFRSEFPRSILIDAHFGRELKKLIPDLKKNTNSPYRYLNFPSIEELSKLLGIKNEEEELMLED